MEGFAGKSGSPGAMFIGYPVGPPLRLTDKCPFGVQP
jgi:hypothetical protein